jgi:hypothetical protein
MQSRRRLTELGFSVCEVTFIQRFANSFKVVRPSSPMASPPTFLRSSARRRSASFRSLVRSDLRNCLSPLLRSAY